MAILSNIGNRVIDFAQRATNEKKVAGHLNALETPCIGGTYVQRRPVDGAV